VCIAEQSLHLLSECLAQTTNKLPLKKHLMRSLSVVSDPPSLLQTGLCYSRYKFSCLYIRPYHPTGSGDGIHHAGNSWCCQISRNVPICLFDALFRELADDVWSAEEFFKSCFWFTNTDQDQAKEDSARLYEDWQSLVIQRNIFTKPIYSSKRDRMICRQLKTWQCKISTDEQREIPTTQDTRFQPQPIYITHSTVG
jgi:hypothetical protein